MRIVVNGVPQGVRYAPLGYGDFVMLAGLPRVGSIYTITWSDRFGNGGSVIPGEQVWPSEGMAVNVYETSRA